MVVVVPKVPGHMTLDFPKYPILRGLQMIWEHWYINLLIITVITSLTAGIILKSIESYFSSQNL